MLSEVIIDGVRYVPEPPPTPSWDCDIVHESFLTTVLSTLDRPIDSWTCGTLDLIGRKVDYAHAAQMLVWYRDKYAELKHLKEKVPKSEYD